MGMVWSREGGSAPTRVTDRPTHSPAGSLGNAPSAPATPVLSPGIYTTWRDAPSGDQSGIDNRALLQGHAVGLEMGFDHLKNLLAEIVLLQQMAEGQDRGLIRDPTADHVDPSETAHRGNLDQRILHRWIAEVVPLLQ